MESIYISGEYLKASPTWHAEDSPWKADRISEIISNNDIHSTRIAEIGCGAGVILEELSKKENFKEVQFSGYDISPQAIELSKQIVCDRVEFYCQDLLSETNSDDFDILLVVDVLEHISDYLEFLNKCRAKAEYKIYHIPLDVHVSSVLRNNLVSARHNLGHLHYFTADTAIATLKDTGHEIVDYCYTRGALELFKQHPSIKTAIANIPRWAVSKFNLPFTARVFGGYSLLVLAK